jgi:hypothetical protein
MQNPNCQIVDFLKLAGVTEIAVGATATAYTLPYPTQKDASYAFEYQLSSGGTITVAASLEQGNVDTVTAAANTAYVVPEDAAAFDAVINDALNHIKAYAPAATAFVRMKFVGSGSNAATTKVIKAKMTIITGV